MDIIKETISDNFAVKFLAMENHKPVGWAYLYVLKNDRHEEPFGFLENVYVEKEYRSQGVGSQLVKEATEEAKKLGCYKLVGTSRHAKTEIHEFYKRLGFAEHGLEFRIDFKDSEIKQRD
jgi:GNAT superfamily N-acetyltransferase